MGEASQVTFSYKEVAESLIKKQGIHEGLWGLYIEFGLGAVNINTEPGGTNLTPAAIVTVQKIGIQRFPEPNSLTVDAAEVNPPPKAAKQGASKKDAK